MEEKPPKEIWQKFERHFKVAFLAEAHPYKVLYGGRDGIKSWSIARQLLIDAAARPLRTLCCRETMMSLDDSVHHLLDVQISRLKLTAHFRVLRAEIQGINGSLFAYAGLRHNAKIIKSYEGFDRAWVEEAVNVSKDSWHILLPTIRKENSEIFVSFNPELESDYTYQYWVMHPPPGAVVKKIGYEDNIWLSEKSRREIAFMKETDPDAFLNVYGGLCLRNIIGAVFSKEMQRVDEEQRVRQVPYDNSRPVDTYWDIGDRFTTIWFAQRFPFETRLLKFFDAEGISINEIAKELQRRSYVYGCHWLPFDSKSPQLGTGRTIEEQLRSAGFKVAVVPRVAVHTRLSMLRTVFPQLWFDGDGCADGLQRIRHYRWAPEGLLGQEKRAPLHDINSHAADALSYMAVVLKSPAAAQPVKQTQRRQTMSPWL